MIAIVITLTIALIAVNAILAIMLYTLKAIRTRYHQDMELAARLARAEAGQHLQHKVKMTDLQKTLKLTQLFERSDLDLIAFRGYSVEDMESILEDGDGREWPISGDAIARLDLLKH